VATLEIPDLNEHVAMPALKKGLRTSRLTFSLDKKFSKSYAELLSRAQKYADTEEQAANRRLIEGKPHSKNKKNRGQGPPISNNNNKYTNRRRSPPRPRTPGGRFDFYTPLNLPREKIFLEIEKENYLQQSRPMKASSFIRNRNKYCL